MSDARLVLAVERGANRKVVAEMSLAQALLIPSLGGGMNIATMAEVHWWLKSAGLTTTVGDLVTAWRPTTIEAHEATSAYDLAPLNDPARPELVTGASGINSKDALLFDGLDDGMLDDDHGALALGPEEAITIGGEAATWRQALHLGGLLYAVKTGPTAFAAVGRDQVTFAFSDPTSSTSWFHGWDTDGKVFVEGLSGNRKTGNTVLTPDTVYVIAVWHDDTTLYISVNSTAQSLTGSDPGWPGDLAEIDNSSIGCRVVSGGADKFAECLLMVGGSGIVAVNEITHVTQIRSTLISEAGV